MPRDGRLLLIVTLVGLRVLVPLVAVHPAWEFHRDEFLYFAMGDHLAWRMQFPPLIAVVAKLGAAVFGDAVWAARVPAALAGGTLMLTVLLMVRRLGGQASALWLAWIALIGAPVFMRSSVLMHPVVFDQLWATVAVSGLVLAAHDREPQWWLLVGAAFGLGLLTKATAVMYGAIALGVTLAHPALRPQLRTRWPWVAGGLAFVLGLPSLLGQMHYGWPFLAQLAVLKQGQFQHTSVLETLEGQLLMLCGAVLMVGAGLWAARPSGADRALKGPAQIAALFALGLLATILLQGGKEYYMAPAYPLLVGIGAVAMGAALKPLAYSALLAVMTAAATLILPMGVPVLAPDTMPRYVAALGEGNTTNMGEQLDLPQDYADMLGWKAQTAAVAEVYASLTPEERAVVTIAAANYGQAGALAVHGRALGLPYPVSTAGDFHAWGPGDRSGEVAIIVAPPDVREVLERLWTTVDDVRQLQDARRVPEERDVRIFVCRTPRHPLRDVWPTIGPSW